PDPLTYKFTVRRGVLWPAYGDMAKYMTRTDREVTSEDIVWYMKTQQAGGFYGRSFASVDKYEVVDRYNFTVRMKEPFSDFLKALSGYGLGLVAKECYDAGNACMENELTIISPGPYYVEQFVPRTITVKRRNPEFWLKGLPYIDSYKNVPITDPAAVKAAFVTGKSHNYEVYTIAEKDLLLKQRPEVAVQSINCTCGAMSMLWHLNKKPFDDLRVRRALNMALDRKALWQATSEGFDAQPTFMPWDYLGLDLPQPLEEHGPYYQYNLEEAKRLLKEAGYSDGFKIAIETGFSSGAQLDKAAVAKEMWKKVGVEADIKIVDNLALTSLRYEKTWRDIWYSWCLQCGQNTADDYMLFFTSDGPFNFSDIKDPWVDQAYLKQRKEVDPAKRKDILWEIERYVRDQLFYLYIGHPTEYEFYPPQVQNGTANMYHWFNPNGMNSWVVMIDPSRAKK
ncbi:MAG: ABC transporter substrate-binding protein, partial [Chloroflexi bacterium]|nr:ABC transporter substrate-binding protein [Chloroflexota bacterium]